ncbi:hypothetical protein HPB52_024552 [Rhipicephalus sanguineus]|uniref:Sister chromatid cohesion protein DCC1 n=1 Tax=Rhipicephalus sanguineus TaxID=34632 RepID=A0A9D4TE59_RHISA|nr:hypothetical protein HPB52_024552 [Rhipicephalus sanguineus]
MIRTDEEVQAFLERAKLDRSDLQPIAQPLWFAEENQSSLRLLEVDKELLKTIREGERLVFRGEEDCPAVVCTGDRTFEVREADISNSLLLVPTLRLSSEVVGNAPDSTPEARPSQVLHTFHSYLELRQCFPRLKKLLELLRQTPYRGAELEHHVDDDKVTPKRKNVPGCALRTPRRSGEGAKGPGCVNKRPQNAYDAEKSASGRQSNIANETRRWWWNKKLGRGHNSAALYE